MNLLCIDTATPQVAVAFARRGSVVGEVRLVVGQQHVEQLMPAVQYLQDQIGFSFSDIAGVGVSTGPGLFTGLRVGITTARSLSQVLRIPIVGIPTLDLIAYPLRYTSASIAAVIDARRHEVFYALYRPVPGGVQRVTDYSIGTPDDVIAELSAQNNEVILAGDGVRKYRQEFTSVERGDYAGHEFDLPSIDALVKLADRKFQREEFQQVADITPLYLRKSDAELNADRGESSW